MASLHKSASKLNATNKRKSGDDMEEDDELPVVSVKTVKRRKDKVSSALTSSFLSRLELSPFFVSLPERPLRSRQHADPSLQMYRSFF